MADDKRGREKQAKRKDRRQREREIDEERSRGDEPDPSESAADGADDAAEGFQRGNGTYPDPPSGCHRRGCEKRAAFVVVERYQEETGKGLVEAKAFLCEEHTAAEGPSNLDAADGGYVFRIERLADGTVV